jgi:hypothetical protein
MQYLLLCGSQQSIRSITIMPSRISRAMHNRLAAEEPTLPNVSKTCTLLKAAYMIRHSIIPDTLLFNAAVEMNGHDN